MSEDIDGMRAGIEQLDDRLHLNDVVITLCAHL